MDIKEQGQMEMVITFRDGRKVYVKGYVTSMQLKHEHGLDSAHEQIPFVIEGLTSMQLGEPPSHYASIEKEFYKDYDAVYHDREIARETVIKHETMWGIDFTKEAEMASMEPIKHDEDFPATTCGFVDAMKSLHAVDIDEDPEIPKLPELPEFPETLLTEDERRKLTDEFVEGLKVNFDFVGGLVKEHYWALTS